MFEPLNDLLSEYSSEVGVIILFGLVFFALLIISRRLLHQFIFSFSPEAQAQRSRLRPRLIRVSLAIADIFAWLFTLTLSCAFLQIPKVTDILIAIIAVLWNFLPWTLVIGLILFCFSRVGNELILSLIGFWYLQSHREELDRQRYFELEHEESAEIEEINLLTTRLRLKKGNKITYRPNAFLMHEFFKFSHSFGIEDIIEVIQSRTSKTTER